MKDVAFLEGILASVWSQDTQRRLKAAEELSNYLSHPSNDIEFGGYEKLIDGLVAWVNSSNFRVRMDTLFYDFQPYFHCWISLSKQVARVEISAK